MIDPSFKVFKRDDCADRPFEMLIHPSVSEADVSDRASQDVMNCSRFLPRMMRHIPHSDTIDNVQVDDLGVFGWTSNNVSREATRCLIHDIIVVSCSTAEKHLHLGWQWVSRDFLRQ